MTQLNSEPDPELGPAVVPPPPNFPPATAPTPPAISYETPPVGYDGPPATKDEANMGMLMFILGIFTGFLGPLIIWLVKKNDSRFLDAQGKEILNYQITVIIALIVNIPLWFIVIGILIHFGIIIATIVFMILGAMAASKGNFYKFPFALRLLK
jgi:uncharacterized Tic20 family protein